MFKAHRRVYHSTLGSRVMRKKKRIKSRVRGRVVAEGVFRGIRVSGFRDSGFDNLVPLETSTS